jgi:hypothetical protein
VSAASKKQMRLALFTFPPFVHHYAEAWRHSQDMSGGLHRQAQSRLYQFI